MSATDLSITQLDSPQMPLPASNTIPPLPTLTGHATSSNPTTTADTEHIHKPIQATDSVEDLANFTDVFRPPQQPTPVPLFNKQPQHSPTSPPNVPQLDEHCHRDREPTESESPSAKGHMRSERQIAKELAKGSQAKLAAAASPRQPGTKKKQPRTPAQQNPDTDTEDKEDTQATSHKKIDAQIHKDEISPTADLYMAPSAGSAHSAPSVPSQPSPVSFSTQMHNPSPTGDPPTEHLDAHMTDAAAFTTNISGHQILANEFQHCSQQVQNFQKQLEQMQATDKAILKQLSTQKTSMEN